jgi:excisionase family DNA binding protein
MYRRADDDAELRACLKVLLTVDEAARALSLGRTYTYQLIMCGQIASIKVGRKRLVPLVALRAFVEVRLAG